MAEKKKTETIWTVTTQKIVVSSSRTYAFGFTGLTHTQHPEPEYDESDSFTDWVREQRIAAGIDPAPQKVKLKDKRVVRQILWSRNLTVHNPNIIDK